METKTYSGKKIATIVVISTAVLVASATSAAAWSTKQKKNVIPAVSTVCSNVADHSTADQEWSSAFGQCVETLGLNIATR